jgi:hypothetical protein
MADVRLVSVIESSISFILGHLGIHNVTATLPTIINRHYFSFPIWLLLQVQARDFHSRSSHLYARHNFQRSLKRSTGGFSRMAKLKGNKVKRTRTANC